VNKVKSKKNHILEAPCITDISRQEAQLS